MPIILRLDRMMADRKMSLNELSERVGVANVNLSKLKNGHVSACAGEQRRQKAACPSKAQHLFAFQITEPMGRDDAIHAEGQLQCTLFCLM